MRLDLKSLPSTLKTYRFLKKWKKRWIKEHRWVSLAIMNQYQQYQAAEAIREAARNEGGGLAGAGAGLGAGAAIGSVMANAFSGNQQQTNFPISAAQPEKMNCPHCEALIQCKRKVLRGMWENGSKAKSSLH